MQPGIAVIELHYLPCISYFSGLLKFDAVLFEAQEHFIKQTYRNRCHIYGANGRHDLIIPVIKKSEKIPIKELKISYDSPWRQIHFKAIKSAYKSSPYFDYYEDDFRKAYEAKEEYLVDFNLTILDRVSKMLKVKLNYSLTEAYQHSYDERFTDLRNTISPKSEDPELPQYIQVFSEKYGFLPNLSIIDLLFNEGSAAKNYLQEIL